MKYLKFLDKIPDKLWDGACFAAELLLMGGLIAFIAKDVYEISRFRQQIGNAQHIGYLARPGDTPLGLCIAEGAEGKEAEICAKYVCDRNGLSSLEKTVLKGGEIIVVPDLNGNTAAGK